MDELLSNYRLSIKDCEEIKLIASKLQPYKDLEFIVNIDTAKKLPYHPQPYKVNNKSTCYSVHNGQTKLLMNEIVAIINTLLINPNLEHIVYAGAAVGSHIWALVKFFPNLKFYLYDTAQFDKDLRKLKNVQIFEEYFTHETAHKWKIDNVMFISDIRTGSVGEVEGTDEIFEKCIQEDMELQKQLVLIMNPCASLLKCRFPFINNPDTLNDGILNDDKIIDVNTVYFEGEFLYQPFSRANSTESRLYVVKDAKMRNYSAKDYEQVYFYINTILREWYMSDIDTKLLNTIRAKTELKNICNCYDCSIMIKIFETYCSLNPQMMLNIVNCINILYDATHQRIPAPHGHIGLMVEYRPYLLTAQDQIKFNRDKKEKIWSSHPIPSSKKYR